MKNQTVKDLNDYVQPPEAMKITGLKRTQLYRLRMKGTLSYIQGEARGIRYYKPDLYRLIGL